GTGDPGGANLAGREGAMTFARPWLLLLLLLIPLWLWFRGRRRPASVRIADGEIAVAAGRRSWLAQLPLIARVIALAALGIAAAGPRLPGDQTTLKREGISIVITIDVSSSMLAEDFAPSNRLEV